MNFSAPRHHHQLIIVVDSGDSNYGSVSISRLDIAQSLATTALGSITGSRSKLVVPAFGVGLFGFFSKIPAGPEGSPFAVAILTRCQEGLCRIGDDHPHEDVIFGELNPLYTG